MTSSKNSHKIFVLFLSLFFEYSMVVCRLVFHSENEFPLSQSITTNSSSQHLQRVCVAFSLRQILSQSHDFWGQFFHIHILTRDQSSIHQSSINFLDHIKEVFQVEPFKRTIFSKSILKVDHIYWKSKFISLQQHILVQFNEGNKKL